MHSCLLCVSLNRLLDISKNGGRSSDCTNYLSFSIWTFSIGRLGRRKGVKKSLSRSSCVGHRLVFSNFANFVYVDDTCSEFRTNLLGHPTPSLLSLSHRLPFFGHWSKSSKLLSPLQPLSLQVTLQANTLPALLVVLLLLQRASNSRVFMVS